MSDTDESVPSLSTSHLSVFEKNLLLDLISSYKGVVECQKTDFGTKTKKDVAWNSIEKAFCSSGGTVSRSADQLRTWWKNYKARSKKKITKHRKSLLKTGGGSAGTPLSPMTEKVCGIVPTQMQPLNNPFDDDADQYTTAYNPLTSSTKKIEASAVTPISPLRKKVKMQKNCLEALKSDKAKVADHRNDKRVQKDARSSLTDMEYEEHKFRLRILAVELETAILLQKKAEGDLEEHELRMEMLKLQVSNLKNHVSFVMQQ